MNLSPMTNIRTILQENGLLTEESRVFFDTLYELVPRNGNGSPEGIIFAPAGATYYDLQAPQGSRHYVKIADSIEDNGIIRGDLGWELT